MSGNTIAEKILADHSISNRSVKPGDIINAKVDLIMSHFGTAKVVVDFMVDEKTVVNLDRCIGCGNCVPTCGMKAMSLKKRDKIENPPKNQGTLYAKILMKKKGVVGSIGLLGKILFRRKM